MNAQSKIAEVTSRFFEMEAQVAHLLADMRAALSEADGEIRRLRAEAECFRLEIFTEEEAAVALKMSQDTLARKRVEKHLPHFRAGTLVRYTNRHLAEIVELLEPRQALRPVGKPASRRNVRRDEEAA